MSYFLYIKIKFFIKIGENFQSNQNVQQIGETFPWNQNVSTDTQEM